jgi:diaminohydroxyphosphoribosylaminopyrimidine deaminase/5-amino-6-(5-phosphoribosylamino)uracil reductase
MTRGADDDARFMRRALALAARGSGETNPNPLVGCVVVKAGRIVGEGWHGRAGGPHAEATALQEAGARARGATLYVNLEPCSHTQKRTPPCAPLVAASGVRRVVTAMRDPNPAVNGRGVARIRRAGVVVETGLLEAEARRLNERFVVAEVKRRPFVLLKAALTLDGRIATASGESRWITSPAQRRVARGLRRLHDGVLVGIGTVLADDPSLLPSPRTRRPFTRIVLDSRLRLPLGSRLVRTARQSPVVVVAVRGHDLARRRLERAGVTVLIDPRGRARVTISGALRVLWGHGIRSLMAEGGTEVLGSFLAARLFDQVALFRAPLLLGGRHSRPAFGGPNPRGIGEALRLRGPSLPSFELWRPRKRSVEGRGRSRAR